MQLCHFPYATMLNKTLGLSKPNSYKLTDSLVWSYELSLPKFVVPIVHHMSHKPSSRKRRRSDGKKLIKSVGVPSRSPLSLSPCY